jgi:hypothetical protein
MGKNLEKKIMKVQMGSVSNRNNWNFLLLNLKLKEFTPHQLSQHRMTDSFGFLGEIDFIYLTNLG